MKKTIKLYAKKTLSVLAILAVAIFIYATPKLQYHKTPLSCVFQINFNSSIRYKTFFLENPTRWVLDLKNVPEKHIQLPLIDQSCDVNNIRFGRPDQKTLRLVFDLKEKYTPKLAKLNQGHALQIRFTNRASLKAPRGKAEKNSNQMAQSLTKKKKESPNLFSQARDIVVVIDPGHGGKDPGATGKSGVHEKDVVIKIARFLQEDINQMPGFKAYLTRKGDYYLKLRQRLDVARKYQPDLFISIHADAFHNSKSKGASVFALSPRGATSEAARWLANRENESELMGGVDLSDKAHVLKSVLLDLSQTATIGSSLEIGRHIIGQLRKNTSLHHRRVEQAAFVVLKSPDIPSLLVETGFLSNRSEERKLRRSSYQKLVADSLSRGIFQYFENHPPRHSWLAQKKQSWVSYRVKPGDTLSAIAWRFGVTVSELINKNQLKSSQLHVGQSLNIPKVSISS